MPLTTGTREENKLDLAAELLRKGEAICLRALGTSMLPSIWPGDLLSIESTSDAEAFFGDIVLIERGHRFFIHRLIKRQDSQCITRGDSLPQNDAPVAEVQVLGKVSAIQRRDGAVIPVSQLRPLQRAAAAVLCRCDTLRNIALRLRGILVTPPSRRLSWRRPHPHRQQQDTL